MSFEPRDYLRHILVEADYLLGQSTGVSFDDFGVDYEIVWDVVQNRIPELRRGIASIVEA